MVSKPIKPDSTAFALNIRNFGALGQDLQARWTLDFLNAGRSEVPLPRRLIVELLNSCNYDCPMCRVGRYGINYERKLPFSDFVDVLDQLKDSLEEVRLNGLGESTLLPDFERYIDELVPRKLKIELISNGSGRIEDYESLLKNNGIVIISWDASEKRTFEILRRPAQWERSVDRLRQIADVARKYGKAERLFLMFTLQHLNIAELPGLVRKCAEWGIHSIIINVVKLPGDAMKGDLDQVRIAFHSATALATDLNIKLLLPDQVCGVKVYETNALATSSSGCTMPWEEAVLKWNGDVQVCNMFNPYVLGNIRLNPFDVIWNNTFAQVFRKNVNTDTRHPYCVDCVYMRDVYAAR